MNLAIAILAAVTLERLAELPYARSNTQRLIAAGAHEVAPRHYPLIVALHALWLATLWWLAPDRAVEPYWLAAFVLIELARIWTLATLGRRWTTRIIVVPGEQLVKRGPYRFIDHPNYAIVVAEIAVLPMVFGLWPVALMFSLLNAGLLTVRIGEENRALGR